MPEEDDDLKYNLKRVKRDWMGQKIFTESLQSLYSTFTSKK